MHGQQSNFHVERLDRVFEEGWQQRPRAARGHERETSHKSLARKIRACMLKHRFP